MVKDSRQCLWNIVKENHPKITRDAFDAIYDAAFHFGWMAGRYDGEKPTERELREITEKYDLPKEQRPYWLGK